MNRFHVSKVEGNTLTISNAQFHHLKDVLRLRVGDDIVVFDNQGNEYACAISELHRKQAVLMVKSKKAAESKQVRVTVACAIPKKAMMDDIIDGLTQLGVDSIIPMETERVIVELDSAKKAARLERWQRIARSAAQQSQRNSVPDVGPIASIEDVIAQSKGFDLRLIPTLAGDRRLIREVLAGSRPHNILVLIGPEGDFTPREIELAKGAGFVPASLGESVLRVGTAALAVVSYIRFSLGA